jgi:hypothetical protein
MANWGDKPGAQRRFLSPVGEPSPGFSPQVASRGQAARGDDEFGDI